MRSASNRFTQSIGRGLLIVLLACAGFGLGNMACVSLDADRVQSPYYDQQAGRYRNLDNDDAIANKDFFDVLYWKTIGPTEAPAPGTADLDDAPPAPRQLQSEDLLAPENTVRIVWLGHSTVWIASNRNGRRFHLITDPVFEGILFTPRLIDFPIPPEQLPPIDVIAISHPHLDHFNFDSVRYLQQRNPQARLYLPSGTGQIARDNELKNLRILEWWQSESLLRTSNANAASGSGDAAGRVHYLPAHHWSRMGVNDTMQSHWLSYAFEVDGRLIYFAGDTGYSSHFQKIAAKFPQGFDAALMPIGAFKPRWFMRHAHVDPPEAVQASNELAVRRILPVHWGTFNLGDERPREAIVYLEKILRERGQLDQAHLWVPGGVHDLLN